MHLALSVPATLVVAAVTAVPVATPVVRQVVHPSLGTELRPGILLVAARTLIDPNFRETVVLLVDYDRRGAYGVILNRPMPLAAHEALPDLPELRNRDVGLYFGGPVGLDSIRVLLRSERQPDGARTVVPGVQHFADREILREVLGSADPELRLFAGYAGWAPGQLDAEVAGGDWILLKASAETVFHPRPAELWDRLHELGAGQWAQGPPRLPHANQFTVPPPAHRAGRASTRTLPGASTEPASAYHAAGDRCRLMASRAFAARIPERPSRCSTSCLPGRSR